MATYKFVLDSTFYAKVKPAANNDNIDAFAFIADDVNFARDSVISGVWDIYTACIYLTSKLTPYIEQSQHDHYFQMAKDLLKSPFFTWEKAIIKQSEHILMFNWDVFLDLGYQVMDGLITVRQAIDLFIFYIRDKITHFLHCQSIIYFELCLIGNIESKISV